jgi:glutathione S-transferase
MDSWPIAHTLESLYPSPSLHLSNPIVIKIRDHIPNIMKPLTGFTIPKAPTKLLNPRAAEYFNETRKERFGMSLVEVEEKTATDEKWEEARKPVMEAADWLKSSGGPFFLGETVSYADFIFVGMMHMMKRMDEEVFQRFLEFDPVFGKLYEACEPWLKKDD